jgi:hypothetical protein
MNKQILLLIAGCIACTLFVLSIVLAVLYMTQKPECENDGETKLTEVCTKSEDTFRFLTGTDDSDDCKKGKYFYDGACHDVSKSSKEASDARATAPETASSAGSGAPTNSGSSAGSGAPTNSGSSAGSGAPTNSGSSADSDTGTGGSDTSLPAPPAKDYSAELVSVGKVFFGAGLHGTKTAESQEECKVSATLLGGAYYSYAPSNIEPNNNCSWSDHISEQNTGPEPNYSIYKVTGNGRG